MNQSGHKQEQDWTPVATAAFLLEVSERQVRRDAEELNELQVPTFSYIRYSGGFDRNSYSILRRYRELKKQRRTEAAMQAILEEYRERIS